jgi:hypothetical protein
MSRLSDELFEKARVFNTNEEIADILNDLENHIVELEDERDDAVEAAENLQDEVDRLEEELETLRED